VEGIMKIPLMDTAAISEAISAAVLGSASVFTFKGIVVGDGYTGCTEGTIGSI
jgi:hypothetical protein